MQAQFLLPRVDPHSFPPVERCRTPHCGGKVVLRQTVWKSLVDTQRRAVRIRRYFCWRCRKTFRVYPTGVSRAPTSERMKALAVLLYLLGLSYDQVSRVLFCLHSVPKDYRTKSEIASWYHRTSKRPLSKTAVYYAVQAAGEGVRRLRATVLYPDHGEPVHAFMDGRLCIEWAGGPSLTASPTASPETEVVLTSDLVPYSREAAPLIMWMRDIAALVGAEVLVFNDIEDPETQGQLTQHQ